MKFSEKWLREWINPPIDAQALGMQLTMAGLEIEAISPAANPFKGVIVGEVLSTEPHPDADRLKICKVNSGSGEPLQIVCGASNVRPGLKVPLAMLGAELSAEFKIKPAKLRGIESQGMLCSASELGLAEKSEGLLELPADAPIGTDLREYLKLDDNILELKITPNRGDCLSITGVAREVSVINHLDLTTPKFQNIPATLKDELPIKLTASQGCARYLGRIIRQVNLQKSSPLWLQEKLRRSNIRSINPVVDVTNYVMLELGQPMHAFDLNKLKGFIEARLAKPGEKIALLNEQEVILDNKTLVIADANQPQAIAGVMGGSYAAVSNTTTDIFLEAAFFDALTINHAVQTYLLNSDSSQRFERGVDYHLAHRAIERASELILSIVGGEAGPVTEAVDKTKLPSNKVIHLRRARINRILGTSIADTEVVAILQRLGMTVITETDGWRVTPPSYRFDMAIEVDLIEELARIYGYDRIPAHLPTAPLQIKTQPETEINLTRLRHLLLDRGYYEAISYSFIPEKLQQLLDPQQKAKALSNPISLDMAVMRTNLWPGLIQAAIYNQNRQESRIRLFETGLCFTEINGKLLQKPHLAGIMIGSVNPEQWGIKSAPADFFDIKKDVQAILALTNSENNFYFEPSKHPALHPHKAAAVFYEQQYIGDVGALHPTIQQALKIDDSVYLFELDLESLQKGKLPHFMELSKFPSVRRDIAVVIKQDITAAAIENTIRKASNDLLQQIQLFDVYQGQGIEAGHKSIALGLIFQDPKRTLTDAEINDQIKQIINMLQIEFHAKLRE